MKFQMILDQNQEEKIVATVHKRTPLIDRIEELAVSEGKPDTIPGYCDDETRILDISEIECIFVESKKTYAVCSDRQRYQLHMKLYEAESLLPSSFIRINKSALANTKRISRFIAGITGAVNVVFASGYTDYVSRRCFSDIRKRYKV